MFVRVFVSAFYEYVITKSFKQPEKNLLID